MTLRRGNISQSCADEYSEGVNKFKSFIVFFFFAITILDGCSESPSKGMSATPVIEKVPGFIGLWTTYNGTIYGGWGWRSGELLQTAFNFGVNGIENAANLDGYSFQTNLINNCTIWKTNQVYGIIEPPNGHSAAVNQPGDTALFQPFASSVGMIQAAHRFSELSKIYPQISGIIIDDFGGSYLQQSGITTAQLRAIRDALHGKTLDATGNIVAASKATTPNLKLYVVDYQSSPITDRSLDTLIDGVNLFIDNDQNANYMNLEQYISAVKQAYPGKGIIVGVDVSTGRTPVSIKYMIRQSIDLYDRGEIDAVLLFWGWFLIKQGVPVGRWDSLAIPPFLDSLYYPNLGEATGMVIDAGTGDPIPNAVVTVRRITGKNIQLVTRKYTSTVGEYSFGGWARNNSSVYEVEVAKFPYLPKTFDAKLQPGMKIELPSVRLAQ